MMLNSIRLAGDGMQAGLDKLEVTAQNLANIDTVGYKKNITVVHTFKNTLQDALNHRPAMRIQTSTSYKQGALKFTKGQLDFAIKGDAFFTVETDKGTAYTRAGIFSIDNEGFLITTSGDRVLDTSLSPIEVGKGNFTVDEKGNVYQDNQKTAQLQLSEFENKEDLYKVGEAYFKSTNDAGRVKAENVTVMQGYLESSNVSSIEAMIEMITIISTVRNSESAKEVIKTQDQTLSKVINELGQT